MKLEKLTLKLPAKISRTRCKYETVAPDISFPSDSELRTIVDAITRSNLIYDKDLNFRVAFLSDNN